MQIKPIVNGLLYPIIAGIVIVFVTPLVEPTLPPPPPCPDHPTGIRLLKDAEAGDIITKEMIIVGPANDGWPTTANHVVGGKLTKDLPKCSELSAENIGA
jgi:hypothetical protein